jgi:hypothetical protein
MWVVRGSFLSCIAIVFTALGFELRKSAMRLRTSPSCGAMGTVISCQLGLVIGAGAIGRQRQNGANRVGQRDGFFEEVTDKRNRRDWLSSSSTDYYERDGQGDTLLKPAPSSASKKADT